MERHKTRPALELGKLIPGVILVGLGLLLIVALEGLSLWSLGLMGLGGTLIAIARLGQACVACRRSMKRREYAFSPWIAGQLREAIDQADGAAMAEIVRGPRIDHQVATRTSLILGYCDKCKRVTTVQATEINEGRRPRVIANREMVGEAMTPLAQAAADIMP